MTLDELNFIKNKLLNSEGKWESCGKPNCKTCNWEKKVIELMDREIKLKTMNPVKD